MSESERTLHARALDDDIRGLPANLEHDYAELRRVAGELAYMTGRMDVLNAIADLKRAKAENAVMREIAEAVANGATLYDEMSFPTYGGNLQDIEAEPIGRRWICADCKKSVATTESDAARAMGDIQHIAECAVMKARAVLATGAAKE